MVGPLTVKKSDPLPAELEDFVTGNGDHGFIIVSFGSYMETVMSKERIDVFGAAFGKLKQKVLWKLKSTKIDHIVVFDFFCLVLFVSCLFF